MALQNAFNAVKSKALGVAEYMTPVLKVKLLIEIINGKFIGKHPQGPF